MSQIAEAAGVSTSTVSLVLSGNKPTNGSIRLETKQRVQEIALQLGYNSSDNRGARQLAARKHGVKIFNNIIAVSAASNVDQAGPPQYHAFESEIMHGIEMAAYLHGLDVLICRHHQNKLPRLLEKREVDGIISLITTPQSLQQITESGIPAVALISKCEHLHNVTVSNFQGMFEAVQHMVSLGHRKIAYIGRPVAYDVEDSVLLEASRERFAGYRQAMENAGLPVEYVDFYQSAHSLSTAGTSIESLWGQSNGQITAVACYNDVLAMGVIRGLEKLGVRVPDDVSVTGFDDISEQFAFRPLITSVHYDRGELGKRAVESLWNSRAQWLANEKIDLTHELLPVELKVRETTASPHQ
jgi:DNA-binding LacI/PurR family transcriptional regulator